MKLKLRPIFTTVGISVLLGAVIPLTPALAAGDTGAPDTQSAPTATDVDVDAFVGAELPCDAAIDLAASQIENPSDGYSFVCIPGQGATATPGESLSPERLEAADAERRAAKEQESMQRTPYGNTCSITQYTRQIFNHINEVFDMCIFYGQKYPTYEWYDNIKVSGSAFLGWQGHNVNFYVDNGWGNPNGSFSWTVSLYKGQFGQVPVETDFHNYSMIFPGTYSDSVIVRNNTSRETGTYHIRFHKMRVVVPSYDFDKEVDNFHAGFRFVCNRADAGGFDQCEWPDGQEAF
ncbi:MAG: hypothetical protein K0R99_3799 [Microbacterium sp.]|uniref:hypothetical protein n=1 Tax=Microbacterium sp. TaxID=51671 RepID=UPI00261C8C93|nr:hypothetical protein [Microbacterium sp.]MDF2562353.1 hypothetical protein [Microbacterium sp.]